MRNLLKNAQKEEEPLSSEDDEAEEEEDEHAMDTEASLTDGER